MGAGGGPQRWARRAGGLAGAAAGLGLAASGLAWAARCGGRALRRRRGRACGRCGGGGLRPGSCGLCGAAGGVLWSLGEGGRAGGCLTCPACKGSGRMKCLNCLGEGFL